MFNTMQTAKKIREARIAGNMTQMQLADSLGVSYQAVSNWERANSMPDIAKLEELCSLLSISIDELLGNERTAENVKKIIERKEGTSVPAIPLDEMTELLPMLPPKQAEEYIDVSVEAEKKLDLKQIRPLAPFLDEEYLDELVERADITSLKELTPLLPFLSNKALGKLVEKAELSGDDTEIVSLAPFLDDEILEKFIEKKLAAGNFPENPGQIHGLLPFLNQKTVQRLAEELMKKGDFNIMKSVAPFL